MIYCTSEVPTEKATRRSRKEYTIVQFVRMYRLRKQHAARGRNIRYTVLRWYRRRKQHTARGRNIRYTVRSEVPPEKATGRSRMEYTIVQFARRYGLRKQNAAR